VLIQTDRHDEGRTRLKSKIIVHWFHTHKSQLNYILSKTNMLVTEKNQNIDTICVILLQVSFSFLFILR